MLEIEGFPEMSDYIELPNMADLLKSPFFVSISADDAYKHGGELVRFLLEKTPIKNDKKYITVTSQVQYLTPEFCSVRSEAKPAGDWHVDSTGLSGDDINYLLLSHTDCNTEFNDKPFIIEGFDANSYQGDFVRHINYNEVGITPRMLEGNRMVSFGSRHIHRAVNANNPTLRYMWRVSESNHLKPVPKNENTFGKSYVYKYKLPFLNIEQVGNSVIIHL